MASCIFFLQYSIFTISIQIMINIFINGCISIFLCLLCFLSLFEHFIYFVHLFIS